MKAYFGQLNILEQLGNLTTAGDDNALLIAGLGINIQMTLKTWNTPEHNYSSTRISQREPKHTSLAGLQSLTKGTNTQTI
ncbi:hypothetical protein E2C01_053875 [Portunus trituberculatus]|uniref:Uncharacterized protein n=1 Tax=Portunus trituberculatus TaxID=210409 RepID=A0A5B7GRN3_PORTR|nr:hypothetical protein [Portunus trituberculatus]